MNGSITPAHAATTTHASLRRSPSAASVPTLTPLVIAMLAAFPLHGEAQVAVTRPPAPAAFVVPRPMPGWRVTGAGAAAPVNVANRAGGTDQTINQTSQRAIYNWQNFDIGSASSVMFNFPGKDSSALNRVVGPAAPSQIFGALSSQYPNPVAGQAPLTGGSVYLVNANGILFGRNSQVNVGSLIASTLNIGNSDFMSGLTNSIASTDATFAYDGAPELFTNEKNFVVVDPGATITTANGGRVFLFAKNVQNAGTISTPGGQTALAGGSQVYLNDPTSERLYASEVNPSFPALRGLLVEVGQGSGSVANLAGGRIDTPRGNTTLVAMAVNQSGRISATTSVAENGSVMLLARGSAVGGHDDRNNLQKHATTSGALTLGANSSVLIAPDTELNASGKPATTDANSIFTRSRVELEGKTVELQSGASGTSGTSGASVVAHGGIVNVRAEPVPFYQSNNNDSVAFDWSAFKGDTGTRLIVGDKVKIDVSGTTTTSVSVARNFVTTELLGKSDLKDAPLQKDGPLYRAKVTFDLRNAIPILGDTSSYRSAIRRTAEEQLSSGGAISLTSTGALVTHPGSSLNVSGGQVTYTEAMVNETRLIAADGTRLTLDKAPKDTLYVGIEGAAKAVTQDRWGVVVQHVASQSQTGSLALGYLDGQAGGALTVVAPRALLDGQLQAATVAGVRQTGGQDPVAAAASVTLGFRNDGSYSFGDKSFITSGLRDLTISKDSQALPDDFWAAPLSVDVPVTSRVSAATLNASGVGKLTVTTDGSIALLEGAALALAPKSSVDLAAGGVGGIRIGANYQSEGGSFSARTRDLYATAVAGASRSGAVVLGAGKAIDVSGHWVNRSRDGATVAAAAAGGSVTLSSARALNLLDTSRIDVSGGATVSTAGAVKGTNAGSITLESNVLRNASENASLMHIGADLKGRSLVGGGTLALRGADQVLLAAQPTPRGVKDGTALGALVLSDEFFRNGAFTKYDIQAAGSLQVQPGAVISPKASNWILTASASHMASGTDLSAFMDQGQLPDAQRKAVSVSLGAVTPFGANPAGDLSVGAGAVIRTDPLATVTLAAGLNLDVEGQIHAPGGNVNLSLRETPGVGTAETPLAGTLRVGATAVIDVSGTSVLQIQTGLFPQGRVLAGGNIDIQTSPVTARLTSVEILNGATLQADGASARLGVTVTTASGGTRVREQVVNSPGGTINIVAREGGATLAGDLHALGGHAAAASNSNPDSAAAADGSFSLKLSGVRAGVGPEAINLVDTYTLVVQNAPITQADAVAGSVQVSAQSLAAGFADVSLQSMDRIRLIGDVNLAVKRNLILDAPLIVASPQSKTVVLSGGSSVLMGSTPNSDIPSVTTAIPGRAKLTLQGGLVEFYGEQGLRGFAAVNANAMSEISLNGVSQNSVQQGRLALKADLTLNAPQVTVTSNSDFTIDAAGQKVVITGGVASAPAPLSAGGSVTINARAISTLNADGPTQFGVLRAPFGSLTLNASDRIDIGPGSVLSVTGNALTVPFGSTIGGAAWSYNNVLLDAPVTKTVSLNAKTVNVKAGSTLDASGGGNLMASEFVAGSGGSKDIFGGFAGGAFALVPGITGFAPQDADILAQRDATGANAVLQLGRQIVIGAGAPLPAGTYAVLPARYAITSGAFLVRPVASSAPLDVGAAISKPDGSVLVGGLLTNVGAAANGLSQTFQVLTSAQAQAFSEIRQTNANEYFTRQAAATDAAVPRLPTDAGRVNISADQLTLKGAMLFTHADAARGGELDISANRILIGSGQAAPSGVLSLDTADLNATGASLLVIGGRREGVNLQASAAEVIVDNAGQALKGADIVLVANERVELRAGAAVQATGTRAATASNADALNLSGDGALLRVSNDAAASSVRTNAIRDAGDLVIGAAAQLQGASITAEATHATTLASDARVLASSVTIGANRMAVGPVDATQVGDTTLIITPALAAQLDKTGSLTLRSFDGIDFFGASSLGSSTVQSLTIDSGNLRVADNNVGTNAGTSASARIEAGGVRLVNTSGSDSSVTIGSGQLQIVASGAVGGTGQILIGPGSVAISGVTSLGLNATREVVVSGQTSLMASGDIAVRASAIQATRGSAATLGTSGQFSLDSSGTAAGSSAESGAGAHLAINAGSIEQAGRIVLPSGELTLTAAGTPNGNGVHFAAGSVTDVSGRSKSFDGVTVATSGGAIRVATAAGNLALDANAVLDVSAALSSGSSSASAGGSAGSLTLAAPGGSVTIGGSLRGLSAPGQGGASLVVDSASPVDLSALSVTLAAGAGNVSNVGNFSESITVRNRVGDQLLDASGPGLSAHHVSISTDDGSLAVSGRLDASGASGTSITLAAGNTLTIQDGAKLTAHSAGNVGGEVRLMAGTASVQADGSLLRNGQVQLDGGLIDTTAGAGGVNGSVLIRAQRNDTNTDVQIGQGPGGQATSVLGATRVEVEAVRQYQAASVGQALITKVNADNAAFAGAHGANAAQVRNRVGALLAQPQNIQLRSGVEVIQADPTADMVVTGNATAGGWNLTSFDALGKALAQPTGAPVNLTLRAAGNLNVRASISDGFMPSGVAPTSAAAASKITPAAVVAQVGGAYVDGARIRLIGGADLGAADVMTTQASPHTGDITIGTAGKDVLIRSTTGAVEIAAGRDITLANRRAVVYTTGKPVNNPEGHVAATYQPASYLTGSAGTQSAILTGGGGVSVQASRDVLGATDSAPQYAAEWLWRGLDAAGGQPAWWARYDRFKQGFATFGGGNVSVAAGRDALNVEASAATSGYIARDAAGNLAGLRRNGGGDLSLTAQRDITGGFMLDDAGTLIARSGRNIASAADATALQLLHGNSQVDVEARNDLDLGLVTSFGLIRATKQAGIRPLTTYIAGLAPLATLRAVADAGDLNYQALAATDGATATAEPHNVKSTGIDKVIPSVAIFAAPAGSVTLGTVTQIPGMGSSLNILANLNATVTTVTVAGTNPWQATPTYINDGQAIQLSTVFGSGLAPLDLGDRSPVRITASLGDASIITSLNSVKPLQLTAGRDVVLGTATSFDGVVVQHQADNELSSVQAGRDLVFPNSGRTNGADLKVYGPGNLLAVAGRNIDLKTSGGVGALGNRENAALPDHSAGVTVMAGVSLGASDYAQASAWYFPLLGGSGIAGFAGDLAAQLGALQASQVLPAIGSSAAASFKAASISDQVAQAKLLAGPAIFNAAVLADARRRQSSPTNDAAITPAAAVLAFDALNAADKSTVIGAALATAWAANVPVQQQRDQVLAMLGTQDGTKSALAATALATFVAAQSGKSGLDVAHTLAAFGDLSKEQQGVFINQVLIGEIRSAGRAASALTGAQRDAAYQQAYRALQVVFPDEGTDGDLKMGSSQLRTYQNSAITVLTPRGGVDVGELVAGPNPKPASALGIVTGAGGDVSIAVRDSVAVNQSRVFTVGQGDLLMWASQGNLDAGRGAKTVTGAPPPVFKFDANGNFVIDTSGSFTGSGIAVLNANSTLDLYAPKGEINAGDAGIKSLGNAFLGAARFVGADNLAIAGVAVGAPPPAPSGSDTAGLASVGQAATSAGTAVAPGDSDEEKDRKRRKRMNMILDFLGFGDGAPKS